MTGQEIEQSQMSRKRNAQRDLGSSEIKYVLAGLQNQISYLKEEIESSTRIHVAILEYLGVDYCEIEPGVFAVKKKEEK